MRPGNGNSAEVEIGGATSFNPPASDSTDSANFYDLYVAPTITGISSGNTTALYVNPTITTTNLTGTNLIAAFPVLVLRRRLLTIQGIITQARRLENRRALSRQLLLLQQLVALSLN